MIPVSAYAIRALHRCRRHGKIGAAGWTSDLPYLKLYKATGGAKPMIDGQ